MNQRRSTSVRGFFNQLHEALHGRNALRLGVTENRPAIHQHLKLVVLMAHLRADGVSRFDLSLQAPGQASQAASKQASANFDVGVGVHGYFFLHYIHLGDGVGPVELQHRGARASLVEADGELLGW